MIKLSGEKAVNSWCIYTLHDAAGKLAFVWHCKLSNVCSLKDAMVNPAFNMNEEYTLTIAQIYKTQREASNAATAYMQLYGMPELNKTIRFHRYSQVKCDQTGKVWRNQRACAIELGLNQAQLSQHLRRAAGYKSIKGLTYSNVVQPVTAKPVQYP